MSAGRAHGVPTTQTRAAADTLVEGLGSLLRAQLAVASSDVTKAAAVTEAAARELECMRKDACSINAYCQSCDQKITGSGGDGMLASTLSSIDSCYDETVLLEEAIGQLEAHMASLEERWGRLKR